jgi:quercetin dioxygenase-like cupin family protein
MAKVNLGGIKTHKTNIVHRNDLPDIVVYEYFKGDQHMIVVGEENAKDVPEKHTKIVAKHSMIKPPAWLFEVSVQKGSQTPMHAHEGDTITYVISGRCRSQVGDEISEVTAGDCVFHPKGVLHQNTALEDCVWVEIKIPPPVSD